MEDRPDFRATYERADSLSGVLSPTEYSRVIRDILTPLRAVYHRHRIPESAVTHIFISSAAYTEWVRDEVTAAVLEVAPGMIYGSLAMVGVSNDCVALLFGLDADGMVIAGTGSDILFRSSKEAPRLYQVGGDDWVAADSGSAFWIGLRGLRAAYTDLQSDSESVLLQRLHEHYNIKRTDPGYPRPLYGKLRELSIANAEMKKEIARFARPVCSAAERGDESARQIVLSEARELADQTVECVRKAYPQPPTEITIVQCGGVFRNELYRASFEQQFDGHLRYNDDYNTIVNWLMVPTATGAAVNLARVIRDDPMSLMSMDPSYRPLLIAMSPTTKIF